MYNSEDEMLVKNSGSVRSVDFMSVSVSEWGYIHIGVVVIVREGISERPLKAKKPCSVAVFLHANFEFYAPFGAIHIRKEVRTL